MIVTGLVGVVFDGQKGISPATSLASWTIDYGSMLKAPPVSQKCRSAIGENRIVGASVSRTFGSVSLSESFDCYFLFGCLAVSSVPRLCAGLVPI